MKYRYRKILLIVNEITSYILMFIGMAIAIFCFLLLVYLLTK